jgi:uncharacterized membrane protein
MTRFLTEEEETLLVEEIRKQEARTSAEIRVCVTDKLIFRPQRYAWRLFDSIGMRDTRERNAALIVMMPRVKKIVVIGDSALHEIVGAPYWQNVVSAMVREMHASGPLNAIREGLHRLGDTLANHWPRRDDDTNELPDEILK